MKNFWQKLKKPIMCSAPMSGVTDAAFRYILAKYGKPDVIFTEFVSCDGLASEGKKKLLAQLQFDKSEQPIVAQLFGSTLENFYSTAKLCQKLGFDGIDINMGCPDKDVIKQRAGAHLIREPRLVSEIIKATKKGAGSLPVSVKTRVGYTSSQESASWISHLLKHSPAVITIHGRTKKQRYQGEVHWEKIKEAKLLAQKISPKTLIIGNGDIKTLGEAEKKAKTYNLDGIMIGRALLTNPLFFNKRRNIEDFSIQERVNLLLEHVILFKKLYPKRNFSDIKKFYSAYLSGFKGAKAFRIKLMKANDIKDLKKLLR